MDNFQSADAIRTRFSKAMSALYQQEVPQYGTLMQLVMTVNERTLEANVGLKIVFLRQMNSADLALNVTALFVSAPLTNSPCCDRCLP